MFNYTAATDAELDGDAHKDDVSHVQRHLGIAKKRFQTVEDVCVKAVLMSADVIVSTCIGAGVRTLSSHFACNCAM